MYANGFEKNQLTWFDRDGRRLDALTEPGQFGEIAIAPDGAGVAMDARGPDGADISVLDLERGVATRLTCNGDGRAPVWSPDGRRIVFARDGDLYLQDSRGASDAQELYASDERKTPNDWSSDGRFLLFTSTSLTTGFDVWVMPMSGDEGAPRPFVQTTGQDGLASFPPDGRYVVYLSSESGQNEVYVRSFPDGEERWKVSQDGGVDPRWRRDGREILYLYGPRTLMGVDVTTNPVLELGTPRALFESTFVHAGSWDRNNAYDVTADGDRLLVTAPSEGDFPSLTVLLNRQTLPEE